MSNFLEELKRRKVFRVAATYAVVAWILMQIGEVTFPALNIPEWVMSTLVVILLAGFPIAVIFAWIFDKTPKGYLKTDPLTKSSPIEDRKKQPFYKLKRNWVLVAGVLAGLLIGWYGGGAGINSNIVSQSINEKSIAVLPFAVLIVSYEKTSSSICELTSSPFDFLSMTPLPSCNITSPILA